MRGFNILLIWIMALAVTIAYAGEKGSAKPTRYEAKEDKKTPPPERYEEEEEEEDFVPEPEEEEEVIYDEEEKVPAPPRRHVSLSIGASFGRQLGCMIPNCGSFMPIQRTCGFQVQGYYNQCMPPQPMINGRPVIYQDVYVNGGAEHPNNFQLRAPCPCQGMVTCACARPTTNFVFINQMTPFPNVTPRWAPHQVRMQPAFIPQPQATFEVPQQHQTVSNPRDFGFTPREGYAPTSGMYGI